MYLTLLYRQTGTIQGEGKLSFLGPWIGPKTRADDLVFNTENVI